MAEHLLAKEGIMRDGGDSPARASRLDKPNCAAHPIEEEATWGQVLGTPHVAVALSVLIWNGLSSTRELAGYRACREPPTGR
jgi:hypothetical protein